MIELSDSSRLFIIFVFDNMKVIAILIVIFCCYLMFRVERKYKIAIVILGTLVFTIVRVPIVPLHYANFLIPLSFLISEYKYISLYFRQTKGTIIYKLFLLSILMCIITILFSPHLHNIRSLVYYVLGELFFKYFALLYSFWSFKDHESLKPTLKLTFYGMLTLTFFGLLNYVTKTADFVNLMLSDVDNNIDDGNAGMMFAEKQRFRVQSMFFLPFDYGYICVIMLLLHIYGVILNMERRSIFYVVLFCCLFGILTCGCRTILFCAILGIVVFFLFSYKLKRFFKILFLFILLFIIAYSFIPFVNEKVNTMVTIFDMNSEVEGSSLEMRKIQFGAVLFHIKDSLLFGRGYGYFNIDLGWGKGKDFLLDPDLSGLEGVAFSYLLEKGFVGIALYLFYYISLFSYCLRHRRKSKLTSALGLAFLSTYFTFANMTGELNSVYPTLLLMGYVVKIIDNSRV